MLQAKYLMPGLIDAQLSRPDLMVGKKKALPRPPIYTSEVQMNSMCCSTPTAKLESYPAAPYLA